MIIYEECCYFFNGELFYFYSSALKAQEKVTGKDPVKNIESVNVSGKQNLDALTVPRKLRFYTIRDTW
jgi:iron complex outermembrane receptor protein